ncbi:MAG TPA: TlpA disulfide reductase family protein [Burkholderiaceae bacterium]|mgnify:CR=1 FL=1|nr:TlpA disulfide reductase family protein [Burkholderiaceae bacterium]
MTRASPILPGPRRRVLAACCAGALAGAAPRVLLAQPAGASPAASPGSAASASSASSAPASSAPAPSAVPAAVGAPFDFPPLTLLDGTAWSPESWRGLAAAVVFWGTWCPFCHRHNEHVEKLHRELAGRPMRVLGVALDRDPALVRRHVRERGYTFPNVVGADALRVRLVSRRVTPTTVTFDRAGRLLQRIPGEMFEEDVLALARLADAPPPA